MNNLKSKWEAITALQKLYIDTQEGFDKSAVKINVGITKAIHALQDMKPAEQEVVMELPSAQPDLDEWCTDCKEYDQERHSCPRWNRVIKQTKEDFEAQNEIIHCTDCRYHGTAICRIWSRYGTINTPGYGFCYRAERKETDETD